MVLNYIWIGFFVISFVIGIVKLVFFQDMEVFPQIMNATFEYARTGFDISLGLTGVLTLWMGLMKIGERGGDRGNGEMGKWGLLTHKHLFPILLPTKINFLSDKPLGVLLPICS